MHPQLAPKVLLLAAISVIVMSRIPSSLQFAAAEREANKLPTTSSSILVEPLHLFASKLFLQTRASDQNVILSPLSIHQALNLVLLGADANTQTESELLATLGYRPTTEQLKYHEAYKSVNGVLNEVNQIGLRAHKANQERKPDEPVHGRFGLEKPPIVDTWNTVIAKNKAEFKPKYKEQVEKYYNSSVARIDDAAPESKTKLAERVNKWAKEAGFQSQVLKVSDLDEQFSALLMTAIRVEAAWFDDFYEHQEENIFYNLGEREKLVKQGTVLSRHELHSGSYIEFASSDKIKYKGRHERLAKQHSAAMNELAGLSFHVVEVPLQGRVKFTIMEPLEQAPGALNKLLANLLAVDPKGNQTKLMRTLEVLDSEEARNGLDRLSFPKFKFENEIKLNGPLQSAGLRRVFSKDSAQLGNMMDHKLCVDQVKHQAMIELDKFGLKAAAITTVKLVPLSAFHSLEPVNVDVKNPFLFMVRYERLPLFMGQLVKV